MRYLFLDIDGVLNRDSTKNKLISHPLLMGLDPYLVDKFLSWYQKQKELQIILSSSWRQYPEMVKEIEASDISLSGQTKLLPNLKRGYEIRKYLDDHSCTRYVILDDTQDMLPEQFHFFVQTSPVHGLRDKNLLKAERILNG